MHNHTGFLCGYWELNSVLFFASKYSTYWGNSPAPGNQITIRAIIYWPKELHFAVCTTVFLYYQCWQWTVNSTVNKLCFKRGLQFREAPVGMGGTAFGWRTTLDSQGQTWSPMISLNTCVQVQTVVKTAAPLTEVVTQLLAILVSHATTGRWPPGP